MTWEQFDIDMKEVRNQFWKLGYTFIMISYTFLGLITSTIVGLILKNIVKV